VDHIVKPFNADALVAKVRVFLERHPSRRGLALRAREAAGSHIPHRVA
jgi:DNA-binding response OmpR family regulator